LSLRRPAPPPKGILRGRGTAKRWRGRCYCSDRGPTALEAVRRAHPHRAGLDDTAEAALDGGRIEGRDVGLVVVGDVFVVAVEDVEQFAIDFEVGELARAAQVDHG